MSIIIHYCHYGNYLLYGTKKEFFDFNKEAHP